MRFFPIFVLVAATLATIFLYHPILERNLPPDNHLVLLASRFLEFKVDLNPINLPRGDVAEFFDKRYIYFGPFSSLIFIPFVLVFGKSFPQELLGPAAMVVAFLAVWQLAKKFAFNQPDRLWLGIFFVFSTIFWGNSLIPISAYQVQILATTLTLLSLVAYYQKWSPLVIGSFLAAAGMTRLPLYLGAVFFAFEFLFKRLNFRQLIVIALPVALSLLLLGAYNYKRFRTPFESGYSFNMTHHTYPLDTNLKYGLTSLNYLPTNLYALLVKAPEPVLEPGGGFLLQWPYFKVTGWGFAIWYSSPLFLWLLFHLKKTSLTVSALATTLVVAFPSLIFFSVGFAQYGYRYSLDFLPFLLLALLGSLKPKLTTSHKVLIVLGILFNNILLRLYYY